MQLMFGLYAGLGLLALLLYRPLTSAVEMAEDWLAFASRPERPTRSQGGTEGSNPLSSSRESCELAISRRIADCFRRNHSSPTSCARSENGGTGDDCARYAISTQRERGGPSRANRLRV